MLQGITRTATQLTQLATGKVGGAASPQGGSFASVIRREQPSAPAPAAGGPLSARPTPPAQAPQAAEGPGLAERSARRMVEGRRRLERTMRRALRGDDFSAPQLLALQLQVHKYTIEVEAVSRVVDRVAGGVKQAMQTQI